MIKSRNFQTEASLRHKEPVISATIITPRLTHSNSVK